MKKKTGTMTLSTAAAATLFEHEIKGQMSDGMWENSQPHDHWEFWCDLDVEVGEEDHVQETVSLQECKKAGYNLTSKELLSAIGDRMVAMGRMATAFHRMLTREEARASEYMPATLEAFRASRASGGWAYSFVKDYMDAIDDAGAELFYLQTYTECHLRRDLGHIKAAIKGVKVRHPRWAHHFEGR